MSRSFLVVALAVTVGGCAGTAVAEPALPASASTTERLADDLARADTAYRERDTATLAPLVERIALATPKNLDEQAPDQLTEWRSLVPDTRPPMRGRALGPGYMRGMVAAGAIRVTEQLLLSGETASIAVGATPRGNLRLRIIDGDGKTVCERTPAHARDCRFVPIFTQRYKIELSNAGKQDARFYLVVD